MVYHVGMILKMHLMFIFSGITIHEHSSIDLRRCADAKEQKPELLAVVVIVSSFATDFRQRSRLRRTDFRDAQLLDTRSVFHPSSASTGTISKIVKDVRPVCVQPMFVISPWHELSTPGSAVQKDAWHKMVSEFKSHHDILIAPTIIDRNTRARELMYILEWSRQSAPWADYVVSMDTTVQINWQRMIELFPPPVPHTRSGRSLWHLGNNDPSRNALLYQDPRASTWRQCADVGVAAFSRDLVHQMTGMPFSTQILYALGNPFRVYKSSCKSGRLWQNCPSLLSYRKLTGLLFYALQELRLFVYFTPHGLAKQTMNTLNHTFSKKISPI